MAYLWRSASPPRTAQARIAAPVLWVWRLAIGLLVASTILVVTPAPPAGAQTVDPGTDQATFQTVAELDELTEDHATIFRLYWAYFLRDPDQRGALYWIERHERCTPLDEVSAAFAQSGEFANRYGRLDDDAFVAQIYRNVLGRSGEEAGLVYWTERVESGELSRGEVVLYVSLSEEFRFRHRYPSDGVEGRGCRLTAGEPTPRYPSVLSTSPPPVIATVDIDDDAGSTIEVAAPAAVIERAGFHQSTHPGAQAMAAVRPSSIAMNTLDSRGRGTHPRGAIDVAVHPLVPITAPVAGTVLRAGNYTLYCTYRDGYVVVAPDERPDWEVKILHMQDVSVRSGDRVEVGEPIAARATPFPFQSQIDELTAEPSWPHVHIEVVDPSIPRRPSSGSSC